MLQEPDFDPQDALQVLLAFYLHALLAQAGDFMRELGTHGTCLGCLGMMCNSGAECRHEYRRRAFRRTLRGGFWAKHDPELANKANMSAFFTLREILILQFGSQPPTYSATRKLSVWPPSPPLHRVRGRPLLGWCATSPLEADDG